MKSIKELQARYQQELKIKGKDYTKIKDKILSDDEVQEFIRKYEDGIDNQMIENNLSELYWLIRFREEPEYRFYSLKLEIVNGAIVHRFFERKEYLPLLNKPAYKRKLNLEMASLDNQAASLHDYYPDVGRAKLIEEVNKILDTYQDGKFSTGLWVVGNNGIGKSYLMAGLAKELNNRLSSVTMIEMNEYVTRLKAEMNKNSSNLEKMLNEAETVDVLIIDDIGAELLTDWVVDEVIYRILNSRHKYNKTTFFTSNLTKVDYANKLYAMTSTKNDQKSIRQRSKRVMTRIDALAKEVQTSGNNLRKLNS